MKPLLHIALAAFISCLLASLTANGDLVDESAVCIWSTHSAHKVMEDEVAPATAPVEMSMAAARDEYEAAQLIIRASAPLEDFQVYAGHLISEEGPRISNRFIEIRQAMYVPLPHYQRTAPDPLPPLKKKIEVPSNKNLPLFFIVHVPRGAHAGHYVAPISLRWKGGRMDTRLHLQVWNFTLPRTPSCVTAFGYQKDHIAEKHGYSPSDPEAQELYIKYYDMMLDYRISPYHLPVPYEARNAWSYMEDPRLTSHVVRYPDDDKELKKIVHLLKQNKWWDKCFFYPVDEPVEKESYDRLHREAQRIKQVAPDARICTPFYCRPIFDQKKTPMDLATDDTNIWCVNSHRWDLDAGIRDGMKAMAQRGDALWWYVCCGPDRPYSNFFIDMDGMDHRMLFWQQKREGIQGLLYWSTTWWHPDPALGTGPDPWTDMATIKHINPDIYGDGSLFYPGSKVEVDGPVPSQRLLVIRDGIEDFEYLCLLEKKQGRQAVLDAIGQLVTSMTDYSKDTRQLEKVREFMARQITSVH